MFRSCSITLAGLAACLVFAVTSIQAAPNSFEAAKVMARQQVYHDRTTEGTFYCGCRWQWTGRSGGRVDLDSCGYQVRAQDQRAQRIEWEHIVPASLFGQQRQCWQQGGRGNCSRTDPLFNIMEADLHNLTPAIGEVNADRSNYRFAMLPDTPYRHGACPFKVEFNQRAAEPRDEVKGMIARTYFYMHDRYNLRLSDQQERLLMAWDNRHAPSSWELERNQRISRLMGHANPFVDGQRQWLKGHRNLAEGLQTHQAESQYNSLANNGPVIGNRRSQVYHLPQGCPGYQQVSPQNQVHFASEAEALAQGYRRAGNCR
ncbi:deoxyribonuclease I [Pseudomonas sp. WN033]|nr:deoxyribonuclease I [Pseudomonas sp. WN033]